MSNNNWNNGRTDDGAASPMTVMRKQPIVSIQPPRLSSQAAWTIVGLLTVFTVILALVFWRRVAGQPPAANAQTAVDGSPGDLNPETTYE
ncbi:MAG: hypothetical protein KC418_08200 [Anaerolineales bacterium]|nr:hypothetical protein [Anaerolineales bacterium]MCB8951233.1 hypothetical protein [Ardenticatenales bacterium]